LLCSFCSSRSIASITASSPLAESFGCDLAEELDLPVYLYRLKLATRGSGLVGEMTTLIGEAFGNLHVQGKKAKTNSGINSVFILVVDEADALVQSRAAQQMHHEDRAGVDAFLAGVDSLAGAQLRSWSCCAPTGSARSTRPSCAAPPRRSPSTGPPTSSAMTFCATPCTASTS